MNTQAKISYSAVLIGLRRDASTINVPESMAGITRDAHLPRPQLNRREILAFLDSYVQKAHHRTDHIDLTITVETQDGFQYHETFRNGFNTIFGDREPLFAYMDEIPQTRQEAPAKAEQPKESKYAAKQRRAAQEASQEAQEAAPVAPQTKEKAKKPFQWRDRTDDEDAIPDDQLTPSQRRKRQRIAEAAERQSYASFSSRR